MRNIIHDVKTYTSSVFKHTEIFQIERDKPGYENFLSVPFDWPKSLEYLNSLEI